MVGPDAALEAVSMQRSTRSRVDVPRVAPLVLALALSFLGTGCGPDTPLPSVTITAPADGAVVTGSRMVTVAGTFAHATEVEVAVGDDPPQTAVLAGGGFSSMVVVGNGAVTITATATGPGGTATDAVAVTYPYVPLTTNQAAATVVGWPAFDTPSADVASPSSFRRPIGRPWFDGDRLVISDFHGAQALAFEPVPSQPGAAAAWFLGSDDGTGGPVSRDPGATYGPTSLQAVDGRLFLLETGNQRLQVFDPVPDASGAVGDYVVGKADFADADMGCARATWGDAEDFHIGGGRLVVADTSHHRVLVYLSVPTGPGALPDLVLGQAGFDACQANRGLAAAPDSLRGPEGVWTDGERLVVADTSNHRVLVWTAFPTVSGQPAAMVLGQSDFTTSTPAAGAQGMEQPVKVDGNGNQLAVADAGNARVLVWDTFPTTMQEAADFVLGQEDFDGSAGYAGQPNARNFWQPSGVAFGPDGLVVLDTLARRALVFGAAY
jgi:hypothetical protein